MRYAQVDSVTGLVESVGVTFDDSLTLPAGLIVIEDNTLSDKAVLESVYDSTSGKFTHVGPRPPMSKLDTATLAWVPDTEHLLSGKLVEVDNERARRTSLPIVYASSEFDADTQAQRNVQAWQTQLAAGVLLPEGFAWRDLFNVNHPADAAFVNGLGEAMALRGTALYQAAWAHKAALAALADAGDTQGLVDYSVEAGW